MESSPNFHDDANRLDELMALELLDSDSETEFDQIVSLVAQMTECPIALISLVDKDRQWFKAKVGVDISETPRTNSFCDMAIRQDEVFVVPDTLLDERFKDNPLVVNPPHIRFYAAQPLLTSSGYRIGTLCAIDQKPRTLSDQQLKYLSTLAKQTIRLMELRLANRRMSVLHTQLEQARNDAYRANEAKSSFLANMSHEIRTPLGAILGYADLLRDEKISAAQRLRFIETINKNGETLKKIIDDILDLAKVESGKLLIEHIEFSPDKIFKDVLNLFEAPAHKKGIKLIAKLSPKLPARLVSDPNRLKQILTNLIGNSIKFTEAGEVKLVVDDPIPGPNGLKLRISVLDTGIGVSEEDRDKLFKPFSQGSSGIDKKFGGTGLGLALSRRLAQNLGGDITLERPSSGPGVHFIVEILAAPVLETGTEKQLQGQQDQNQNMDLHGKKFLVVDDSEDNLFLAKYLLEKNGAMVQVAKNGIEAVNKCQSEDYDLILMDIQMPEMDGYQATRTLRSKGFEKPIVALTAHAMKEDQARTKAAGCNAHLAKPLNRAQLFDTIHTQFDSQSHPIH